MSVMVSSAMLKRVSLVGQGVREGVHTVSLCVPLGCQRVYLQDYGSGLGQVAKLESFILGTAHYEI